MSSNEVLGWGSLSPLPENEGPFPLEIARGYHVRRVCAGFGAAVLAGTKNVIRLPNRKWAHSNDTSDPWSFSNIDSAAFGLHHSLLLRTTDSDGTKKTTGTSTVLAYGSGSQGQLGLGACTLETKLPRPILALERFTVVQIACGAQHSAAVTSTGDLFTWGRGIEGQLGHSSCHLSSEINEAITGVQFQPRVVPTFLNKRKRARPVRGVACGHNFTVVVTQTGEVWAFGDGTTGQLGIGRFTKVPTPTLVIASCPVSGEPFVEAAAGWGHTLARTEGGHLFSWGFNALGSLGLGDNCTRFTPELVELDINARMRGNQCSDTNTVKIIKLQASGNCSGALVADGTLFTWGNNSGGQLGHREHPERGHCTLRPRCVSCFAKANILDFALCSGGGVALVPLRVLSIQPTSGPMEDGCHVSIRGTGFWDSLNIVVKFTPVTRGRKAVAARSTVGSYMVNAGSRLIAYRGGQGQKSIEEGSNSESDGTGYISCRAPSFASPDEVYVEISVDGTTFTMDGTKFRYYRRPAPNRITPNRCRPPFPNLRIDGDDITPSDNLLVQFEEEESESNGRITGPPRGNSLEASSERRVFVVPGCVQSELVGVGEEADTGDPIYEERFFISCNAPSLQQGRYTLPFIARVSIAPNGETFSEEGSPLIFIAHDPHADKCLPIAVPIPSPTARASKGTDIDLTRVLLTVTGRNLYDSGYLSGRLRFGSDSDNILPLEEVAFDERSSSITAVVPATISLLVGLTGEPVTPGSSAGFHSASQAARKVVVELSVSGDEYFTVPERLTLYNDSQLKVKGNGRLPAEEGGTVELTLPTPSFRGHNPKVRLLSVVHSLDVVLPLLQSLPSATSCDVDPRTDALAPEIATEAVGSVPDNKKYDRCTVNPNQGSCDKLQSAQGEDREYDEQDGATYGNGNAPAGTNDGWEEEEVPVSKEPFFFIAPPLRTLVASKGSSVTASHGLTEDNESTTSARASAEEEQRRIRTTPARKGNDLKQQEEQGSKQEADTEGMQENAVPDADELIPTDRTLRIYVSLNGTEDWRPVDGPSLTYFQPIVEPAESEADPVEAKKMKVRKK